MLRSNGHFGLPIALLAILTGWLILTEFACLMAAEPDQAVYDPLVAANQDDATLRSVIAVTAERVVAVGDRGLVLTSENGGSSWNRRSSGTTANLYSVEFLDSWRGWAVGGTIQARSRTSIGVVLETFDGGASWRIRTSGKLPRLTGVTVLAHGRLVAHGDYASQFSSSVFESFDGGATWRGISLPMGHAQAVGWSSTGVGLALDRLGGSCIVSSPNSTILSAVFEPLRPVYTLAHTGKHWLAGGESGQLLSSIDGKVWNELPLPLNQSARRMCAWHSIAQRNNRVWIAGYPGSVILHSSDYGATFEKSNDNHSLPKFDLSFADSNRGWAVGPGGSILATRDGGATWQVQRSNWQRLAVQSIVSRVSNVPWPALVSVAWDDRRATAGLVLQAENLEESADFLPEQATTAKDLAPQVGIADLRILPKYPAAGFSVDGAGRDDSELIDDLVTAIRVWKPDVVLTENPTSKQKFERITASTVQRAIHLAATSSEGLARAAVELNLDAWRVKKTVAVSEKSHAGFSILRDQVLRDAGLTVADVLLPLGEIASRDNLEIPMRTVDDQRITEAARNSLLGGIAPADDTHRRLSLKGVGNYQFVMARVHREASIQRLQGMKDNGPTDRETWKSQLEFLLKNLPKPEVGPTLIRVAEESLRRQQWHRWQIALELLAAESPTLDSTRWSQLQLSNLSASDELHAWRRSNSSQQSAYTEAAPVQDFPVNPSVRSASWSETPFESAVITAAATGSLPDLVASDAARFDASIPVISTVTTPYDEYAQNLRSSLERFRSIAGSDSFLSSRPDQLLAQQSRLRRFSETTESPAAVPSNLQFVASHGALAGWKQVAEQELQLLAGRIDSLRWVAFAAKTDRPPLLDGQLDEEFWHRAQPIELTSPSGSLSPAASQLRWAYDERYLYLTAVCPRANPQPRTNSSPNRQYDMNLADTDHIHILLDTDRDYATAHELGINDRGETFDRTCGLQEWNPKWYVAVTETDQMWVAEAAIELEELTIMSSVAGRAWAISAYRYIPDSKVQSWSRLNTAKPLLQASGLLLLKP